MRRMCRVGIVAIAVAIAAACATGRAVNNAERAVRAGDWDTAVAYYREAVTRDPDNIELRIALERATREASQAHLKRARELEQQDQIPGAAAEYKLAAELDPGNSFAQTKAMQLEQQMRAQLEASRAPDRMEALRQQAAQTSPVPRLDPRTPVVSLRFGTTAGASVRDIINSIAQAAGITVTYDAALPTLNATYAIELVDTPLEDALNQVLTANSLTFKVLNPRTIFVYADNQTGRQKYEDVYIQTFYLAHGDPTEINTLLQQVIMQGVSNRPIIQPNKTSRSITVRATLPLLELVEQVIRANDKPTAEVLVDVQIMQVDRNRAKQLGLDLNNLAIGLNFSPEVTPAAGSTVSQFNLNTLQSGVRPADFFVTVPTATIRLLETDEKTRLLAKTQLRGRAGTLLNLQLGERIPYATATIASQTINQQFLPPTQIQYEPVGITVQFTPQVTPSNEIILENLTVQKSARGPDVPVLGQVQPSFTTNTAQVTLRLRDGETNMLAGLISEEERKGFRTLPGFSSLPILRNIFGSENTTSEENELIILVTPHILMSNGITADDLRPIAAGTSQNIGSGIPRLSTAGAAPPASTVPLTGALPPGTPPPAPPAGATTPPATPPAGQTPPGGRAVGVVPVEPAGATAPTPSATSPTIAAMTGSTDFVMSGGPYPVTVRVSNMNGLGAMSLAITYNPAVLRAVVVNAGSFMQQGDVTPTFVPKIDSTAGRIDLSISRPAERPGATGTGDVAVIMFEPVAPGTSTITISGSAASVPGAGGTAQVITPQFLPANITVRRE